MDAMVLSGLIAACAPQVSPVTMAAVVQVESSGNEFAINVNRARRQPPQQTSLAGAAKVASWHIDRGFSVDIGLSQINSNNLSWLGLTVSEALDPCTNIAAGARILTDAYTSASKARPDEQVALRAALSAYNTGDYVRGTLNGYVARYYGGAVHSDVPVAPVTQATTISVAPTVKEDVYALTIAHLMPNE